MRDKTQQYKKKMMIILIKKDWNGKGTKMKCLVNEGKYGCGRRKKKKKIIIITECQLGSKGVRVKMKTNKKWTEQRGKRLIALQKVNRMLSVLYTHTIYVF